MRAKLSSAIQRLTAGYGTFGNQHDTLPLLLNRTTSSTSTSPMSMTTTSALMSHTSCTEDELRRIILRDDVDALEKAIKANPELIELRDSDGNTPLLVASEHGSVGAVSSLLSHSASLETLNSEGMSALHLASACGHKSVVSHLLSSGSKVDSVDSSQFTPLLWSSYHNWSEVTHLLLASEANVNARGAYNETALVWASGRGYLNVVNELLHFNAKVDVGDKYGTTPLIWACRKGNRPIVELLLNSNANVDAVGMYSWTPLLMVTKGNHVDLLELLLQRNVNVNVLDKDGLSALAIACKEGFEEIALRLLAAGAHVNQQDRAGDTNLIHAAKNGRVGIVEALIKRYADVNVRGKEHKTALHWAIDRGHTKIVKMLLASNPDLEARTEEGDSALLRAVRTRNVEVVQLLLDRKAKVSAADERGDTALHMAMRSRSRLVVEVLLRNPKHSQLLYKPNKMSETPYAIDLRAAGSGHRTILSQIFGRAHKLNAHEENESILGYDLYSSALADVLTEPALTTPIVVGLYAKWGSGKGFLLAKLREEMVNFVKEWYNPPNMKSNLPLFTLLMLHLSLALGVSTALLHSLLNTEKERNMKTDLGLSSSSLLVGLMTMALFFLLSILIFLVIWRASSLSWSPLGSTMASFLSERLTSLRLVLQVLFYHPPGSAHLERAALPLRLLFTDQAKVVTAGGSSNVNTKMAGHSSVAQILVALLDAIEKQHGKMATRLFRAFRPRPQSSSAPIKLRRMCCLVPYALVSSMCFVALLASVVILNIYFVDQHAIKNKQLDAGNDPQQLNVSSVSLDEYTVSRLDMSSLMFFVVAMFSVVCVVLVANVYTLLHCFRSLLRPHRRQLEQTVSKSEVVRGEGYVHALKTEVNLMLEMVQGLDSFTGQQTRMVVVVDGLDSCEQDKVLAVLDALYSLFCEPSAPFIIVLAIDPHVITKAIEMNISDVYSETSIGGNAYLRNLVHLPFFLQNAGLRRVKLAQQLATTVFKTTMGKSGLGNTWMESEHSEPSRAQMQSSESIANASSRSRRPGSSRSRFSVSKGNESVSSSMASNLNKSGVVGGPWVSHSSDLTKVLLNDDYFSDVNPRSLRRLMNVIYVMGRLLRAFHIDFSWYHLATWVNITEQWPYRLSWIIFFAERFELTLESGASLKDIYDRVRALIPTQRELEPLIEMDRDPKKLDAFLTYHKKTMTLVILKIFLPFTINLDPYLKKVIKEEIQSLEDIGMNIETNMKVDSISRQASSLFLQPLTPRQAMGLSRKRGSHNELAQHNLSAARMMMHNNAAMMYQNKNNMNNNNNNNNNPNYNWLSNNGNNTNLLSVPGMSNTPSMLTPTPTVTNTTTMTTTMTLNSPELRFTSKLATSSCLSQCSVKDVCELINSVEQLSEREKAAFCTVVESNNLNGLVLSRCDLSELKKAIELTFGDWLMFNWLVDKMRDVMTDQRQDGGDRRIKFSISPDKELQMSNPMKKNHMDDLAKEIKEEADKGPKTKRAPKVSLMEKQVTMEEAMISGLLSTLNEDIQEESLTSDITEDLANDPDFDNESDVVYLSSQPTPDRSTGISVVSDVEAAEVVGDVRRRASLRRREVAKEGRPGRLRHLRDRLERLSFSRTVEKDDKEEDPYSWLSWTEPGSPASMAKALSSQSVVSEERGGDRKESDERRRSEDIAVPLLDQRRLLGNNDSDEEEQQTVVIVDGNRRPDVKNVFNKVVVLPDGQVMKANNKEDHSPL